MSLDGEIRTLKCPYCGVAPLETTVSIPIIRSQGMGCVVTHRQLIGCCNCVKKKIAQEIKDAKSNIKLLSTAFFKNLNNPNKKIGRELKKDLSAVREALTEAGISELPENINHTDISYSLAIAMIKADGRIEQDEIDAAIQVGTETFSDFDEKEFRRRLNSYKFLPTIEDLSLLLNLLLDKEAKDGLVKFLVAISAADGDIANEEVKLLKTVAGCLEFEGDVMELLPKV